ncbi:MAG: hypothetical protein RLZZ546_2257, partial [Bacteroidota bacterium]
NINYNTSMERSNINNNNNNLAKSNTI